MAKKKERLGETPLRRLKMRRSGLLRKLDPFAPERLGRIEEEEEEEEESEAKL